MSHLLVSGKFCLAIEGLPGRLSLKGQKSMDVELDTETCDDETLWEKRLPVGSNFMDRKFSVLRKVTLPVESVF